MTRTRRSLTLLLGLAALMSLSACGGAAKSPEPFGGGKAGTAAPADAMAGASEQVQAIYKQSCISCHGGGLEGRVGPATNLQKVGERMSKDQIAKQITSGGNGMPGFGTKLKPEDVDALAAWLASKK
ncbi:cytochrome c [Paenibacillus filicis]|uniref:Cytochrome c n=1 Tax=Paenibacillus gyeongsangnamensis TaxID=3388067 RepID=A0ABT4QB59_9BACL|nr:cytochrome c [Paenibacillus filicis]MCZ8514125.1 cytochrome c [Paenibacillus filicis]